MTTSSLACPVCSRTFSSPQGRAGHESHTQDAAHRAAYEAQRKNRKARQNREPASERTPVAPPAAVVAVPVAPTPAPVVSPSARQLEPPRDETRALGSGPAVRLLPATIPSRPDLGPRLPLPTPRPQAPPAAAVPPAPGEAGRSYTAADFFMALATTPARADLPKWQRWVVGIGILAGLTLAFMWPFIQARRARLDAERRAAQQAGPATPPPLPVALPVSPRPTEFAWPAGSLVKPARSRPFDAPWWAL